MMPHFVHAWVRNDDGQIIGWLCTCGTMDCDEVKR